MIKYEYNDAVNYAGDWFNGNNPNYAYFGKSVDGVQSPHGGNGDCANFVSQCLYAGGLRFKETGSAYRQWYYYTIGGSYKRKSSSWSGANDLRIFVRDTEETPRLNVSEVTWANRAIQLKPGDLVFRLKTAAASESAKRNIEAEHVAIVKSVSTSGTITVYQHSPYSCATWKTAGNRTALYHINGIDTSGGSVEPPATNWQTRYGTALLKKSNTYNVYAKNLQEDLIALDYDCGSAGADGYYGDSTVAAVKAFQGDYGLGVDGLAGDQTKSKLYSLVHGD